MSSPCAQNLYGTRKVTIDTGS